MRYIKIIFALSVCVMLGAFTHVSYASGPACAKLSVDLKYGSSDAGSGSQVTALQNFLAATGYLTATPNGYFGPSTRAAVKTFQASQKISPTGTAGPATRAAIQKISCGVPNQTTTQTQQSVATTTPPTLPAPVPAAPVRAPAAGEALKVGENYAIQWDSALPGSYDIVLQDERGSSIGFIVAGQLGGTSYNWKVGQVHTYVRGEQRMVDVVTGTYRIKIRSASNPFNEKLSDVFTIADRPLIIRSMMPNALPNDDTTVGVMYGSGFRPSSKIFFFDSYANILANNRYISEDGTVIVFSVPRGARSGQHYAYVTNNASSSVSFNLTVTDASAQ